MAQVPGQQRGGGRAIHVIVAEDRDFLTARSRVGDALRGRLHLRDGQRIRQQLANGGVEKIIDRVDVDATASDDPRQHLRHLIALRDSKRSRRAPWIEPIAPNPARHGSRHTEKGRWRLNGQCGCWERHDAFRR